MRNHQRFTTRYKGYGIIEHFIWDFGGELVFEVYPPDIKTFGGYYGSLALARAAIDSLSDTSED